MYGLDLRTVFGQLCRKFCQSVSAALFTLQYVYTHARTAEPSPESAVHMLDTGLVPPANDEVSSGTWQKLNARRHLSSVDNGDGAAPFQRSIRDVCCRAVVIVADRALMMTVVRHKLTGRSE